MGASPILSHPEHQNGESVKQCINNESAMKEIITIGHYAVNTYRAGYGDVLSELTTDNFYTIVGFAPTKCPYKKDEEKDKYLNWKRQNLPLFFFTHSDKRPDKRKNEVFATGYAVIDIDGKPGVKYVSSHPSVCCTNYTSNGTHIFIHTSKLCSSSNFQEWQDTYNTVAYEIWMELCNKYEDGITFDSSSSLFSQGCYLWNTKWEANPSYDRDWNPDNTRYFDADSNVIFEMYGGKYKRADAGTQTVYTKKGTQREGCIDVGKSITEIADNNKRLSERIVKDFKELNYREFLDKHEDKHRIITGSEINYESYTDYEGNVYEMCKTDGKVVKLWMPYMTGRGKSSTIKEGGRKSSLYNHLVRICHLTSESLDPDCVLYNAVYWMYIYCENGANFPKTELIGQVTKVLSTYWQVETTMHIDKRMFITGQTKIDPSTGEVAYMSTSEKISANAKCRKTERIVEVVKMWDPEKSLEWNAEHIRSWENDSTKNLSNNTMKDYLKAAKRMPELVSKFGWLKDIDDRKQTRQESGSKGGKKTKQITIIDIETGETMAFESHQECIEALGISKPTLSKFLKGIKTRLDKHYKLASDFKYPKL